MRIGTREVAAGLAGVVLAAVAVVAPVAPAVAADPVTITPLGWNVVGLDSNKVTTGPNQFPVGGRVCNTTGTPKTLTATWTWLTTPVPGYIVLANGSDATVPA